MAEKKYWLHRISHEWKTSSALLQMGYLSIGFFFGCSNILEKTRANGWNGFEDFANTEWIKGERSRYNLWRFIAQFATGDIVVVPLPSGMFSVYKITGEAIQAADIDINLLSSNISWLTIKDDGIYDIDENRLVDIGFLIPVESIKNDLSRYEYADRFLTARMKIRQTNGDISDIAESVEKTIQSQSPVNLYAHVIDSLAEQLLASIKVNLNPDKLERLVKWYFEKMGASSAYFTAKNEAGKEIGTDADVIAEFEPLKIIFYIQVKMHDALTSDWAVNQIKKYKEYKSQQTSFREDFTYISWVITTADNFSQDAKVLAQESGVRLIAGIDFAKSLIDAGITDINKAFD